MHYFMSMDIRKGFANLWENNGSLVLGQGFLCNDLIEKLFALKKLCNEQPLRLILKVLIHFEDIGMV